MEITERNSVKHYQVGIVSYNIYAVGLNYGSLLQSYALQRYLEKCHISSVVLDYKPYALQDYDLKFPILNILRWHTFRGAGGMLLRFFANWTKYNKFQRFVRQYLTKTTHTYLQRDLLKGVLGKDYEVDTWVCGSDAVWRVSAGKPMDPVFFLHFPEADAKRKVAYAPSMESRRFTSEEESHFKDLVADYAAISLREKESACRISSLLGRPIEWMLDPTLLLEKQDYAFLPKKPAETSYVVVYLTIMRDDRMIKEAAKYAKSKGLPLIEITPFARDYLKYRHTVKCGLGVEEWMGYIQNAETVFTNSFHGACFSILFEKQFWVFESNNSDTRLSDLMEVLDLQNRLTRSGATFSYASETIDYRKVNHLLNQHRQRSYQYLEKNIVSYGNR